MLFAFTTLVVYALLVEGVVFGCIIKWVWQVTRYVYAARDGCEIHTDVGTGGFAAAAVLWRVRAPPDGV